MAHVHNALLLYEEMLISCLRGSLEGEAIYDSRKVGANTGKFIDAEVKIQELVNELLQVKTSALFRKVFG